MLDQIGLERTAITVIPSLDKNPLGEDAGQRKAAVDYLKYCVDCTAALGAKQVGGPVTQTLGHFSGRARPMRNARARARVHRKVGDHAAKHGVRIAIEAVNRFETYFVNTMQGLADYLDFVDHPAITGMYDTFHANIEEADPIAAIATHRKAHDPRAYLRERPRRAGARACALEGDISGDQEIRLRWLADDRSVRPRPAGARRGDPRVAGFFGRAGGGLSRRISRTIRDGSGRRRER